MLQVTLKSPCSMVHGLRDPASMRSTMTATASGTALAVDEQHELVAAQARDRVAFAHAALEPIRHRAQQLVADVMAEAVVDELETIEIDEHDREPRAVSCAAVRIACCKRSCSSERFARPVSVS